MARDITHAQSDHVRTGMHVNYHIVRLTWMWHFGMTGELLNVQPFPSIPLTPRVPQRWFEAMKKENEPEPLIGTAYASQIMASGHPEVRRTTYFVKRICPSIAKAAGCVRNARESWNFQGTGTGTGYEWTSHITDVTVR